jgi:hypothetical protein
MHLARISKTLLNKNNDCCGPCKLPTIASTPLSIQFQNKFLLTALPPSVLCSYLGLCVHILVHEM